MALRRDRRLEVGRGGRLAVNYHEPCMKGKPDNLYGKPRRGETPGRGPVARGGGLGRLRARGRPARGRGFFLFRLLPIEGERAIMRFRFRRGQWRSIGRAGGGWMPGSAARRPPHAVPSSSGLGHRPLTAKTGVRVPLGLPNRPAKPKAPSRGFRLFYIFPAWRPARRPLPAGDPPGPGRPRDGPSCPRVCYHVRDSQNALSPHADSRESRGTRRGSPPAPTRRDRPAGSGRRKAAGCPRAPLGRLRRAPSDRPPGSAWKAGASPPRRRPAAAARRPASPGVTPIRGAPVT